MLGLYKIEAPMEQAVELTGVLRDAGRELAVALGKIDKLNEMTPHLVEVDRLEDEGDRISRQALVSLFAGGIDPMVVIRWKDLFERLEQGIDACERCRPRARGHRREAGLAVGSAGVDLRLHRHRQQYHTAAGRGGGCRGSLRQLMAERAFTRSAAPRRRTA